MRKGFAWVVVVVLGLVLAQAVQRQLSLVINGQASSARAIVVNGQSYVPVSALQGLGVSAQVSGGTLTLTGQPAGGANQRVSVEACLNEFAFNGIWRVRATKVEQGEAFGRNVWAVTLEVRNGTQRTLEPGQTGWRDSSGLTLAFADGSTGTMQSGVLTREYDSTLYFAKVPQGAAVITTLRFDTPQTVAPERLLIQVDPARMQRNLGVSYTTPNPSFRLNLNCSR